WNVAGNAGSMNSAMAFTGIPNLKGGSGGNVFRLGTGLGVTGSITGGAGRDALDYSGYSSGGNVNLGAGTATNIAGGVRSIEDVFGSAFNDTLTAGAGNDVLVGNGGADQLNGGSGGARNILIGGAGMDTLTAGSGGDILIGGYTN